MDLLANDLSVHEQFHDLAGFQDALSRLMALRQTARHFGCHVQCHRKFLDITPIPGMGLRRAIGNLKLESQKRAVMAWLTTSGPFWDDVRRHGEDDWLECSSKLVTDTAAGEAAFRTGIISMS